MISIIRRAVSRVAGFWERGPTYEAARAELGGAPWREVPKSTDAWYILDEDVAAMTAPAESRRMRFAVVGLAAAAAAALLFVLIRPHALEATPPAAAVMAAAASVSPASAPPVETTPTVAAAVKPLRQAVRAHAAHHGVTKVAGKKHAHR
jgi:hypothetical protein